MTATSTSSRTVAEALDVFRGTVASTTTTAAGDRFGLRPHQAEAVSRVLQEFRAGVTRQLIALPTGTGKTRCAVALAEKAKSTLFLCHREELLDQAERAFLEFYPAEDVGVLRGARAELDRRIVVSTIQTAYARRATLTPGAWSLVVVDEAHHSTARTWRATIDHLAPKLLVGLSATPERQDGAPLSHLFEQVTYSLTVREAVRLGLLAPPVGLEVRTDADLDAVRTTAGDFNEGDLARAVDTPERNRAVAVTWDERCHGRRALVFGVTVEHSHHLAGALREVGARAEAVSGDDPQRAQKVAALRAGELDALVNCQLLTEGFDDPAVDAILLARPTKSRGLYTQMAGRGLRLHPGKADCWLIDFTDASRRHRLAGLWDFAGSKLRPPVNAPTRLDRAVDQHDRQHVAAAAFAELSDGRALDVERYLAEIDLLSPPYEVRPQGWERRGGWRVEPATEKQLDALRAAGLEVECTDWTKGQAAATIGALPPTRGQAQLLLALGFDVLSHNWTRTAAGVSIDRAKAAGRVPDWNRMRRLATGRRRRR